MCAAESSSEDENTDRLREAVWSVEPGAHKHTEKSDEQSKRRVPSKHEDDGNELQTTPEFKSHVAKKLGAFLDGCFSEVTPDSRPEACGNGAEEEEDDEDKGFRLFSTSLPGKWWKEPTPPPAPKRPTAPSSSDSDSEMEARLREAAVSVSDLIPPSREEKRETERVNGRGEEDEGSKDSTEPKKKKKKKKKKKAPEEVEKGKDDENKERTEEEQTAEESVRKRNKTKKKRIKLEEGEDE